LRRERGRCDAQRLAGIQSVRRLNQITSWGAAIYQFNRNWFGGAMIYYQRLTGSAADSPIVTQRGTRNQITYGVGVAYAFR
jgi:outer membrane scaffolding protein for murein synthesis (MipA/OmpV family)